MNLSEKRPKWRTARWLLIFVFPIGLLLTEAIYGDDPSYIGCTLLATVACALLLTRLRNPSQAIYPAWVILMVFIVGYYLKFYWMGWVLESGAEWIFDPILLKPAASRELMLQAYALTTLGFTTFCLCAWVLLGRHESRRPPHPETAAGLDPVVRSRVAWLTGTILVIAVPVMLVSGYAQYATGVAIMGAENVYLPFRMAGIIVHTRNITLPCFLLLVVWLAERWQLRQTFNAAVCLLILHGVTQMLLMSSRGALLYMVMPIAFLWTLHGRCTGPRLRLLLALCLAAAILHPVLTQYRHLRLRGDTADIAGAFRAGLSATEGLGQSVGVGFSSLITRVIGVDGLLLALRSPATELSLDNISYYLFNPERSLARIFTQDVVGYGSRVTTHQNAPALLGVFCLIGGTMGIVLGVALWTIFWQLMWHRVQRLRWQTLPVTMAMALLFLFWSTSEGDLDTLPLKALVMAASLLLCETLTRRAISSPATARTTLQDTIWQPPLLAAHGRDGK